MKHFLSIVLIFVILLQSFSKLVLLSNYLLNNEFITLNYCVNKSKPKLKCNGKCHLTKQLKEQEKQESSSKDNSKSVDETQYCSEYNNTVLPQFIYVSTRLSWLFLNGETDNMSPSIFHPPTV